LQTVFATDYAVVVAHMKNRLQPKMQISDENQQRLNQLALQVDQVVHMPHVKTVHDLVEQLDSLDNEFRSQMRIGEAEIDDMVANSFSQYILCVKFLKTFYDQAYLQPFTFLQKLKVYRMAWQEWKSSQQISSLLMSFLIFYMTNPTAPAVFKRNSTESTLVDSVLSSVWWGGSDETSTSFNEHLSTELLFFIDNSISTIPQAMSCACRIMFAITCVALVRFEVMGSLTDAEKRKYWRQIQKDDPRSLALKGDEKRLILNLQNMHQSIAKDPENANVMLNQLYSNLNNLQLDRKRANTKMTAYVITAVLAGASCAWVSTNYSVELLFKHLNVTIHDAPGGNAYSTIRNFVVKAPSEIISVAYGMTAKHLVDLTAQGARWMCIILRAQMYFGNLIEDPRTRAACFALITTVNSGLILFPDALFDIIGHIPGIGIFLKDIANVSKIILGMAAKVPEKLNTGATVASMTARHGNQLENFAWATQIANAIVFYCILREIVDKMEGTDASIFSASGTGLTALFCVIQCLFQMFTQRLLFVDAINVVGRTQSELEPQPRRIRLFKARNLPNVLMKATQNRNKTHVKHFCNAMLSSEAFQQNAPTSVRKHFAKFYKVL